MKPSLRAAALLVAVAAAVARPCFAAWSPTGVPVCAAPGDVAEAVVVADGAGGAFAAWIDNRNVGHNPPQLFVQRITAAGDVAARWPTDGVLVGTADGPQSAPTLLAADDGGVFVAWVQLTTCPYTCGPRVNVQRLTPDGVVASGWPAAGAEAAPLGIANSEQVSPAIVTDGAGGVLVAWFQNTGGVRELRAQRIRANGTRAWSGDALGNVVVAASFYGLELVMASDGAGGGYLAWTAHTGPTNDWVFARRLDATGSSHWATVDTVVIGRAWRTQLRAIPDGLGNAILAWVATSDDYCCYGSEVYVHRLRPEPTGCHPCANVSVSEGPRDQSHPGLAPDGEGGLVVVWEGSEAPGTFAQRFDSTLTRVPGWPADRLVVCDLPAGTRRDPVIASDGPAGFTVAWSDDRVRDGVTLAFATRRAWDGSVPAGWAAGGSLLCPILAPQLVLGIAPSTGGAIPVWMDFRSLRIQQPTPLDALDDLYAQRVATPGPAAGAVSFADSEVTVSRVRLAWTSTPGAVAAVERRTAASAWEGLDLIRADAGGLLRFDDSTVAVGQRYGYRLAVEPIPSRLEGEVWVTVRPATWVDAQVAVTASDATPSAVHVEWTTTTGDVGVAAVEKRTESGDWSALGWIVAGPAGRLVYDDRTVVAGERYGYRLTVYPDNGSTRHIGETWIAVPFPDRLALTASGATPAIGTIGVAFDLPGEGAARLELIDLSGRILESRRVEGLGRGSHTVALGAGRRLPAGVYIVRLEQGGRAVTLRTSLLR